MEMGISMELEDRFENVEQIVSKAVISLCERGATLICLACYYQKVILLYFSDVIHFKNI